MGGSARAWQGSSRRCAQVTVTEVPTAAARKPACVSCGRQYGRPRSPAVEPDSAQDGLLRCLDLVVCDQCWHLAGGSAGIAARLDTAGDALEPLLVLPPDVETLLAGAAEYDVLHPLDRLLVDSGVRWAVLRHIAVPARMTLAGWVLRSAAPDGTRTADSARLWLDQVEARIRAQSGDGGFVYTTRKRRWWRIAHQLACAAAWERRPLTWMAQEEIAAVVGCSTRTVRRVVAWLRDEALLWEVVPGCRLPQQHVPDGETSHEAAERRQRMAEAVSAEQAAIARAHAELDAVRVGHRGAVAVAIARRPVPPPDPVQDELTGLGPDGDPDLYTLADELTALMVNLAPVYELRVPALHTEPGAARTPTSPHIPLTSTNTDDVDSAVEIGHPPQVSNQEIMKSRPVQPVDKQRRAPRGHDQKVIGDNQCITDIAACQDEAEPVAVASGAAAAGDPPPTKQSEAVRAAQWLLGARLDPNLCDGVSTRWLAAQIRAAHLLDRHAWTWEDLADLLHGAPEHLHLPRWIRNPRGWIRARFTNATPLLPPRKLRIVLHIERNSDLLRQRRESDQRDKQRAEIVARRAAIDSCGFCNDLGWLNLGHEAPQARCSHDLSTGGW